MRLIEENSSMRTTKGRLAMAYEATLRQASARPASSAGPGMPRLLFVIQNAVSDCARLR